MSVTRAALLLALALASLVAGTARAQVLDQEQLVYDGGTSARTLPGYRIWQSFTPGSSGRLVRIDMGFFNDMAGTARLEVFEGEGAAGPTVADLDVSVAGVTAPGVTWNEWPVDVPVTAGVPMTFQITPDAATLPDPYGVCIGASNPYSAGTMAIVDPSGTYPVPFDVVFRTWMAADAPDLYRAELPSNLATAPNLHASDVTSPHDDPIPPPAPLLCYALDAAADLRLTKLPFAVRLAWD